MSFVVAPRERVGQAYMEKGDDDMALQHLERALELNPENRMAQRLLRELR